MSDPLPLSPLEAGLRRLHLPTVRRHYPELEQQALQESWSYPEYLERLVQAEIDHRTETRIARSTRKAGFPFLKTLEEFDFSFQRSLQRKALGPYLGPELVSGGRSLILTGPPGVGKTALCIALAYKAIQHGAEAHFVTCTDLINRLRQDVRGAGKDSTAGRDLLYRYYGQLELLDLRFPVDEQHIRVSFTWYARSLGPLPPRRPQGSPKAAPMRPRSSCAAN